MSQVVAAIYWQWNHGHVINMSFSTTENSPVLSAAVDYAVKRAWF